MSKRIPIYHYICFGLILASMFLPYKSYDRYSGGFFQTKTLEELNVMESGLELEFCYFLPIIILITSLVLLIKRVLATAIIGLVLSLVAVLYLPFLSFVLVFTLFGPDRNVELELGYYIAVISVLTYFGFTIVNLVYTVKQRRRDIKNPAKQPSFEKTDLLDDF